MRFLAILLLLANVGMFAWIYIQPSLPLPEHRLAPVPPGIDPLMLLSERQDGVGETGSPPVDEVMVATADVSAEPLDDGLALAAVEPEQVPEIVEPPPPPPRRCQTIGPLIKSADVEQITEELLAAGYDVRERSGKVREPSGYWVYLPSMPAAEAREIVAELDAKGMKDYFIGKENYISLGIFRAKDQAGVRLKQIMALGYNPILDQRYRIRTVHWLDIETTGQPLLGSDAWKKIQSQHTDIRVQRVSCE